MDILVIIKNILFILILYFVLYNTWILIGEYIECKKTMKLLQIKQGLHKIKAIEFERNKKLLWLKNQKLLF